MSRITNGGVTLAAAAALGLTIVPAPGAKAQMAQQIEEIIVTAQRRDQILQNVPIAVTALGQESLETRGISDFGSYLTTVPGASLAEMGNQGNEVKIRGIGSGTSQLSPTTAIYFGDVPIIHTGRSLNSSYNFRLVDMARVEVLRGPQGQLFGANSLGGAIRNVPMAPSMYEFGAKGSLEYFDTDDGSESYSGDITVDVPIVKNEFGIRMTAYTATEGGWYDNIFDGGPALGSLTAYSQPVLQFQPVPQSRVALPGSGATLPPGFPILNLSSMPPSVTGYGPGVLGLNPAAATYQAPSKKREDVNEVEIDGARFMAKWAPFYELEIDLTIAHEEKSSDGNSWAQAVPEVAGTIPGTYIVPKTSPPSGPLAIFPTSANQHFLYAPDAEDYEHASSVDAIAEDEIDLVSLSVYYEMDFAALTSTTGWWERTEALETDLSVLSWVFLTPVPGAVPAMVRREDNPTSFSQEFRLTSNDDGPLTWLAGLFYQKIEQDYNEEVTDLSGMNIYYTAKVVEANMRGVPAPTTQVMGVQDSEFEDEQMAVFGELAYDFTEAWNAALSFRYFEIEQTADIDNGGFFYAGQADTSRDNDEEIFTPKLTVSYAPQDGQLYYTTVSEGFRTGIVNKDLPMSGSTSCAEEAAALGQPGGIQPTDPDTVLNYELGTKLEFLDRRLNVNAAIYQIDWQDLQSQVFLADVTNDPSECNQVAILNVGDAQVRGAELEVSALLSDRLRLDGSYSYIDSEYKDDMPAAGISAGARIDGTPLMSAFVGLTYEFDLFQRLAFVRFDWNYVGEIAAKGTDFQDQEEPFDIGDYHTFNLRTGIELNEHFEVDLWGKNLSNEFGVARNIDLAGEGVPTAFTIRPRSVGATLRWQY